ncbi:MAG TPA: ATP-binding protein, partial [Dehalococcoidia bacterium]|nr:ATP-binding protein [Dehalococcoidia bacterium]
PSISDQMADADRLIETLNREHPEDCHRVDAGVLQGLSPLLRSWDWECKASIRDDEVIAVRPRGVKNLGLAVDLGTTKIAAYLVDMDTGNTLASHGIMNPQIEYGEDVITRISYITGSPEGRKRLQELTVAVLNQLSGELTDEVGTTPDNILEAVIVGNTAIHHFLIGFPVAQLVAAPFIPAVSRALDIRARDIGLKFAAGAYVHILPNIAGFVGADHVAMLLATGAGQADGPVIAIDIGTNTEVSLVGNGRITAVSCASGPAFEGGHIRDGMRAAAGAIERLRIVPDSVPGGLVQCQTVDGAPAVGICGSGIIDTLAQLYMNGIISPEGRMITNHPLVRGDGLDREFLLSGGEEQEGQHTVCITQRDIRELQLAKAAIRTGIQVLLENNRCLDEDIKQVVIAGAFGSYIDISSAIDVGMLPSLPPERFRQVGNAAGAGARLALISVKKRDAARSLASRVKYIELASAPGFMQTFTEATYLGRYRLKDGGREQIQ